MKDFLGVDKTPPSLERSLKATTKLSRELPADIEMESIPPMELSPCLKISMLRHGKHHKIPTLICKNF